MLVPIHLDAFVVNKNKSLWKDVSLSLDNLKPVSYGKFAGLGFYLEKEIEPGVRANALGNGVHLHWTLPDAFRKGKYTDDGSLVFPPAPNRWLVVRTDSAQQIKTWIVESDCLNEDKKAACNWIKENKEAQTIIPISIGNKIAFKDWKKDKIGEVPLTIMAPGNPDFAASYIHCKNVFGLYDDMTDADGKGIKPERPYSDTGFTYQVFGWFADSTENPLAAAPDPKKTAKENFAGTMDKLGWVLPGASNIADADLPKNIICHAMVASVLWKDGDLSKPPTHVNIGIGNSSAEALASLLKDNLKSTELAVPDMLLSAFQYKALVDHGIEGNGLNLLDKKKHARSFLPVDGGTHWVIEAKPKENGPDNKDDQVGMAPFPDKVSTTLLNLNNLQKSYDAAFNKLKSLQAELYALKYKKAFASTMNSAIDASIDKKLLVKKITELAEKAIADIENLKNSLRKLKVKDDKTGKYRGEIIEAYTSLEKLLAEDLPDFIVKEVPAAKYYEPVDPAVAITGLISSSKYASKSSTVNCRIKTQVCDKIDFFNKKAARAANVTTADTVTLINKMISAGIADGIAELMYESFLLSPVTSRFVAQALGELDNIDQVTNLIAGHEQNKQYFIRDDKATAYHPAVFAAGTWTQPWNPLYLEWGVVWKSSYKKNNPNMLAGWKFGDAKTPVDFKYNLKAGKNDTVGIPYYGRTLLSSQLATKVESINDKIKTVMGGNGLFNDMVPMSQSLSGLNTQLLMRYHGLQLPIVTKALKLDDDHKHINDQYSWSPMINNKVFYPVRSGMLTLSMLRVIDSFGQVFEAFKPGKVGLKASRALLKSSAAMTEGGDTFEFEMPPRIIQPARLNFDWVSAKNNEDRITDSDPATSPFCGWFLYNKLDDNISVYDAKGVELFILLEDKKGMVIKKAVPGTTQMKEPNNDTLKEVVKFMERGATAFDSVKKQIIETTDRIQSKASGQQLTMALPIGFPVAVVKAQFAVELKDSPAADQSWKAVIDGNKFEAINYRVAIGNSMSKTDGLSGYFLNNRFDKFILPFGAKSEAPEEEFEIHKLQQLTLLMDPRVEVTLSSAMLPAATYKLPPHVISRELKNINLRFLAAPVLSPKEKLQMPLFERNDISWDFIQGAQVTKDITGDEDKGQLKFDPVEAIEGWVKMNTQQVLNHRKSTAK